jgi:hypothetical protein
LSEPGRRRARAQAAKRIHHCRHNFTPRDVAETWPRTAMGRSRCERRAVFLALSCRSRFEAHGPTAYCWRLVSGLWSSPSSRLELTRRLPRPLFRARWLIAEFNTPLPLRGQRRISPASQILPLNDEQAPSEMP